MFELEYSLTTTTADWFLIRSLVKRFTTRESEASIYSWWNLPKIN